MGKAKLSIGGIQEDQGGDIRSFLGARDTGIFISALPLTSCMALESVPQFPHLEDGARGPECVGFGGGQHSVTGARASLTACRQHARLGLPSGSAQRRGEGGVF